jgi:predicted SPOUT superfamily RNA methylase MTH1
VRLAQSFQDIFVKSPHPNGYDCAIGISENGQDVHDPPVLASVQSAHRNRKHALVVFGGMNGLESAVEADEQLQVPKEKTAQIFDHYLNCCPRKGSRTMRTEEDMLLALSILAPILQRKK